LIVGRLQRGCQLVENLVAFQAVGGLKLFERNIVLPRPVSEKTERTFDARVAQVSSGGQKRNWLKQNEADMRAAFESISRDGQMRSWSTRSLIPGKTDFDR